jgi:mannose-6-phosphate isomerase-like protein (cupin superfamily)
MPTVTYWKESDATGVSHETVHEGVGEIKIRRFFYGQSKMAARFHIWELPPGVVEGSHAHAGEDALEEVYYILQGRGVMQIAGEAVEVSPGDAVLVPPGVDHDLRSLGPEPLRLVLMFGPPAEANWG